MMILAFLVQGYVAISLIVFFHSLQKFIADQNTPNTDKRSWVVLGISTLFWLVVLPLSYLERQANQKVDSEQFEEVEFHLTALPLVERNNSDLNQSNLKFPSNSDDSSQNSSFKKSKIA